MSVFSACSCRKLSPALALLVGLSLHAEDQAAVPDQDLQALLDLLNAPVTVAGRKKQTLDQTPSIVSVIRREEIETYGARDFADIIRKVPGFELGLDLSSTAGIAFRGTWAHEGKVLVMINGQALNDLGFGNFSMLGTIPAAMIERVEIIRGPGSALYGGFAEAAVINIITLRATDTATACLNLAASTMGNRGMGWAANLGMNVPLKDVGGLAVNLGFMDGPTSKGTWTDFQGKSLELNRDNANRQWQHAVLDLNFKEVNVSYVQFRQDRAGQDGFYTVVPPVNGEWQEKNFTRVQNVQVTRPIVLNPAWKLEPLVEYIESTPINEAVNGAALRGNSTSGGAVLSRSKAELIATFAPAESVNLILGGGYYADRAQNIRRDGSPGLRTLAGVDPGVTDPCTFRRSEASRYLLAQYSHTLGAFGLTVGGREEYTPYGNAFAPRLGLTWSPGKGYAKLLFGQAFRIPLIWQSYRMGYVNPAALKPETSKSVELEAGYRFSDYLFGRINAFRTQIDKPIVFLTTGYVNYDKLLTQGLEGEIQARSARAGATLTFSYAKPTGETAPGFLNQGKDQFLGQAQIKGNLGGFVKAGAVTFAIDLNYLGSRDAQNRISGLAAIDAGENAATVFDPAYPVPLLTETKSARTLVNATISVDLPMPGVEVRLKGHNLTGTEDLVIQPYYGGHAPIRMNDRQVTVEFQYRF